MIEEIQDRLLIAAGLGALALVIAGWKLYEITRKPCGCHEAAPDAVSVPASDG